MAAQEGGGGSPSLLSDRKRSRLQALEKKHSSLPPSSPPIVKASVSPAARKFTSPLSRPPSAAANSDAPAYARLSPLVRSGEVIASYMQLSADENNSNVVDSCIRELVQESGKAVRNLDGVLDSRIQDRVLLLDNPAGHGKAVEKARKHAKESLANRSNKHMSMRQHKLFGSYNIPLQYQKFELFLPMHEIWKAYAKQVVTESIGKMIEHTLLQIDLHGAFLAVVQAKVNNQVGVQGIMIRETANTLAILTLSDKLKVIPKAGSVFMYRLNDMCVTLYGDHLLKNDKSSTVKT